MGYKRIEKLSLRKKKKEALLAAKEKKTNPPSLSVAFIKPATAEPKTETPVIELSYPGGFNADDCERW